MTTLLASVEKKLLPTGKLPALVYFEPILRQTLNYCLDVLSSVPKSECLYSVKAATFPFLLRLLHRHGIAGFDASSPSEAAFVNRIFGNRTQLYVTAPGLTDDEIQILKPLGVTCVHVDSVTSLERLLSSNADLPFGIRVNPGIGYSRQRLHESGGIRSRLGLPIDELETVFHLCRKSGRRHLGLHMHITCEAPDFAQQARAVALLNDGLRALDLEGFTFTHLDLGGGLRPPAWDFAGDVLIPRFDAGTVRLLAGEVDHFMSAHKHRLAPGFKVLFEPGDMLVCSAAVLVSRVIENRQNPSGEPHLILDTNINHFPNVLHYGNTPNVLLPPSATGTRKTILAGNSCLGGDHIADANMNEEPPGHLVFDERGSYEYTQYNFFNGRFRPSVYLYSSESRLELCKQDRVEDLTAYWKEEVEVFPKPYQSFHHFEDIARREKDLYLYHPNLRMVSSFEFDAQDFPPPERLKNALLEGFSRYGTTYGRSLGHLETRERIAEHENRMQSRPGFYQSGQVAFTLGAANAIWLTLAGLLGGGLRRLLICCPSYYHFASAAYRQGIPWTMVHQRVPHRLTDAKTIAVERLLPSLDDILSAVDSAPDIGALAVVTPGLPHGGYQSMEDIRYLAEKARQEGWILIVDETLAGLAYDVQAAANWSWLDQSHPVVRIASISKTFGLAGMRIGYFSATGTASRRPDTGEDLFERAADMADTAYSAPPAVLGMVLEAGLEILEKSRSGQSADPDVARYAGNIERLKRRAQRAAEILSEWDISCVVPQAGASLMACLGALPNCERDAEPFFRSLLMSHSLFLELGGHFSQNPAWNFTVARLGLARNEADFDLDLVTFCRFYEEYARKGSAVSLAGQQS